jgi:hypothetical protein
MDNQGKLLAAPDLTNIVSTNNRRHLSLLLCSS